MFGPRTRASIFDPTGASLSSMPGAGSPMRPAKAPARPVLSANGAVSVAPKPVIHRSSSPQVSTAMSRSSSKNRWLNPAAA